MVTYVQPKVRFKCTLCGECCRRYWITVTLDDLVEIFINTKLKPSSITALYNANVAGDWQAPRIRLKDGQYYLVLRKRIDGSCIFNEWVNGKMICSINNFKPLTCRFYPFIYHWSGEVLYFELYDKAVGYCPGVGNGPIVDLVKESEYAVKSRMAKDRFRAFVDYWNTMVNEGLVNGDLETFMNYLDCSIESIINPQSTCISEFKLSELLSRLSTLKASQ